MKNLLIATILSVLFFTFTNASEPIPEHYIVAKLDPSQWWQSSGIQLEDGSVWNIGDYSWNNDYWKPSDRIKISINFSIVIAERLC